MPRKSMAISDVTSRVCSPLRPIGMLAILRRRQSRQHAAHVAERALHAGHRIVAVDLVLQVDAALILHLLQLAEDSRERLDAVADVHLHLAGLLPRFLFEGAE